MAEWILTDDDCSQYVKKLDNTVFKLIQIADFGCSDELYAVYKETIDLEDFHEDDIRQSLHSFGYDSVEDVQNQYGDAFNQIIAECLFEDRICWLPYKFQGAYQECEDYIKQYIQNH